MNEAKIQKFNPLLQYHAGDITKPAVIGEAHLWTILPAIERPKDIRNFEIMDEAEELSQYWASQGNHELAAYFKAIKARAKEKLNLISCAAYFRGWRAGEYIQHFTGIAPGDIDHLSREEAIELKNFLFHAYSCIIAAWLSPSRHGIKLLIRIPVVQSIEEYKKYYGAIHNEFKQYKGWDKCHQSPVQALFRSYDPDILSRDDFDTWDIKVDPPPKPAPVNIPDTSIGSDGWKRRAILKGLRTATANISSPHHYRIRSIARTWGGYCPAYLSKDELIDFLNAVVDSHPYMRHNSTGYKKTIKSGIAVGMQEPHEPSFIPGYGK